jgi:ABC-2 type transport system ATP-binding protein
MLSGSRLLTVEFMPIQPQNAIAVEGLTMHYGSHQVVRGIDFEVNFGEVFAFLGPNGAGKTSTVEILEGFRQRSGGVVRVLEADPAHATSAWRDRVGVVLQDSTPEPDLTVHETLQLYAGFYRRPRPLDEILRITGLEEQASMRNGRLSGGQQRRLDVALALVGDPDLLFLDEPTTGFDPAARRAAWDTIAGLKALGKTIFLTTHYLEEAEYLADRIAVLVAGRIVASGSPLELGGRDHKPSVISFELSPQVDTIEWPDHFAALEPEIHAGRTSLRSANPSDDLTVLLEWARSRSLNISSLEVSLPTLEETYLALTTGGVAP